jgi:hypothetical protein
MSPTARPRRHAAAPFPRRLARAVALATLGGAATTAGAVEPLRQLDVVLLEPGAVIEQRVDGGADGLADYIGRLGAAAADTMRAHPRQLPDAGFIVVAARPGGQARTWFDFAVPLQPETAAALAEAIEAVRPTPVSRDEIVFALKVSLWGGRPDAKVAPVPPEWREAGRQAGRRLGVDELVDRLWPRASP